MAKNTIPIYTGNPINAVATISAANTNRDGTGTIVDIVTGVANDSLIERLNIKATGTTTSGMIRLYAKISGTYHLLTEILVTALTPSGTVKSFEYEETFSDLGYYLKSGYSLAASTHNAETFKIHAQGGEF